MATVASGLARRGHAAVFAYDPRGPVGERLEAGVRGIPVTVRNDVDPAALQRLRAIIRRHAADVVCVNTFRELKVGGLAARLAGRGRVVNRMGAADALYNGIRERLVYRALLDVLARDSEWACARVRRENPWFRGPVLRARNGVDMEALAAVRPAERSDLQSATGETIAAIVGRLTQPQGAPPLVNGLIAAASRIEAAEAPTLRLAFIGEISGGAEDHVRRALAGADERVQLCFLGHRTPSETLRLLAACDLLIRPNSTDGVSFTVLEAMALGLPVIASAAGGLAEVVVNGETGRLIPPGDAAAFSAALVSLMVDPGLRRRMGQAGRRRVEQEFTESRMVDEYEAVFRQAVESRVAA